MLGMYGNRKVNALIYGGAVIVFGLALFLVRSQATVGATSYMRAMIPHHSIAILTSERANIDDVRVRELAERSSRPNAPRSPRWNGSSTTSTTTVSPRRRHRPTAPRPRLRTRRLTDRWAPWHALQQLARAMPARSGQVVDGHVDPIDHVVREGNCVAQPGGGVVAGVE